MPADAKYIKQLAEDRKRVYDGKGKLHESIRENRSLRFLEHEVEIPKAFESSTQVVKSPIIQDMLLRVVSTLTTEEPVIQCPPSGQTDKAQRNSSLRERWTMAMLARLQQQISRPVFRMGIDAACADGIGVWKLVHRPDAWGGMFGKRADWLKSLSPEERKAYKADDGGEATGYVEYTQNFRKSAPPPFVWIDVDPLCYFPAPDTFGTPEVLEISKRGWRPTIKALGAKPVRDGSRWRYEKMRPGEAFPEDADLGENELTTYEHWDGTHTTYQIEDDIVDQFEHGYPRPPYFAFGGHNTSSRDPEKQYLSVIAPFKHLVPTLDRCMTMMTNLMYLNSFPYLKQDPNITDSGIPTDAETVNNIAPGTILRGVEWMTMPGASKELYNSLDMLRQMIDRSGLAAVMYGAGSSTSSGYMVSQLMTAAQLVYRPILLNAEMALEQMITFMWQLIERKIKTEVYVWGAGEVNKTKSWVGLGPRDINGYYAINVAIKPMLPMDEIARGDAGMRWAGAGGISKRYWREELLNIPAPEEMADEIRVEKMMESPRVEDILLQDSAERAGLIKPEPPTVEAPGGPVPLPPVGASPDEMAMQGLAPPGPMVPGASGMPLMPPPPQNAGMPPGPPPIVAQRAPGGPRMGPETPVG